jgi:hypothetical protein
LRVVSHAQLTASQRQALLASLNAPANVVGDTSPPDVPMQIPPSHTPRSDAQDDSPDITTALNIFSDPRLTQRERQLVASFTNLLAAKPSAPANVMRGDIISSLPPYSG